MAAWSFLNRKASDSPSTDEHATNPGAGANATAPSVGAVASYQIASAKEDALKLSAESTKRRGRPPKTDKGNGGSDQRALQNQIDAQIAAQLDQVHDPKAWGALLAAPGDVALTLTGREHWNIKENERQTLGAVGSACARTMMITNPKSLAILMLAAGIFSVYMPRLTLELRHQREEADKAKSAKGKPVEQK